MIKSDIKLPFLALVLGFSILLYLEKCFRIWENKKKVFIRINYYNFKNFELQLSRIVLNIMINMRQRACIRILLESFIVIIVHGYDKCRPKWPNVMLSPDCFRNWCLMCPIEAL